MAIRRSIGKTFLWMYAISSLLLSAAYPHPMEQPQQSQTAMSQYNPDLGPSPAEGDTPSTSQIFDPRVDKTQPPFEPPWLNSFGKLANNLYCPDDYTINLLDVNVIQGVKEKCETTWDVIGEIGKIINEAEQQTAQRAPEAADLNSKPDGGSMPIPDPKFNPYPSILRVLVIITAIVALYAVLISIFSRQRAAFVVVMVSIIIVSIDLVIQKRAFNSRLSNEIKHKRRWLRARRRFDSQWPMIVLGIFTLMLLIEAVLYFAAQTFWR